MREEKAEGSGLLLLPAALPDTFTSRQNSETADNDSPVTPLPPCLTPQARADRTEVHGNVEMKQSEWGHSCRIWGRGGSGAGGSTGSTPSSSDGAYLSMAGI